MNQHIQSVYNQAPWWVKNLLITTYNLRQRPAHDKEYYALLEKYTKIFYDTPYEELRQIQNERFMRLIDLVCSKNKHYKNTLNGINIRSIDDLSRLPILTKDELRSPDIKTDIQAKLIKGNTGGTTGKSLTFYITLQNYIERQACGDFFRGQFGYKYGMPTAWFSGKEVIARRDEKKNTYWVKDYLNNVTYFSTFHLAEEHTFAMAQQIAQDRQLFIVGFPSSIYEVAKAAKENGIDLSFVQAVFPTSEPLIDHQKAVMQEVFQCPIPDQYASSEGAPYIYECTARNLHYDMYSGIFENFNNNSSEVLVTSFTTDYMPLIRYQIGDHVNFANPSAKCSCGSAMPLVESIQGRRSNYVYSKERGKVTVSNISNVVKYLKGINQFQLEQFEEDSILVRVAYKGLEKEQTQKDLEYELRYRLGDEIKLSYEFVDLIPKEPNGKYMMIKNHLKTL